MSIPDFSDGVVDASLLYLRDNATHIHACSGEPANFAAVDGLSLASAESSASDFSAPGAAAGVRRRMTFNGKSGATGTAAGDPVCLVIVDADNSEVLAKLPETSDMTVSVGGPVSFPSFPINSATPTAG